MKFTIPILASLVATSTALFDKNQRMNIPYQQPFLLN
jgi:hypothetical protein